MEQELRSEMIDSRTAEKLIDLALSLGAESAEVYSCRSTETEIMVSNGQADIVTVRTDNGFAVRILKNQRISFGSSNQPDEKGAIELVAELAKRCSLHSPDENNVIPGLEHLPDSEVREPFDPTLTSRPLSEKIKMTLDIEKAALAYDNRVTGFMWLQYSDLVQETAIYNSNGVNCESTGSIATVFAYAVAGDNDTMQTGLNVESSGYFDRLSAKSIGETAARYAIRMLGASSHHTGDYRIVLPPETSSAFLRALSDMLSADRIQKGKSPFRDKLGKSVASELITVVDDGVLPGGLATSSCDAEGMPSETTTLIDKGELKGFLHDSYSAKKDGTHSTGNASRASYHAQPTIVPTNFYLKAGEQSRESILKSVSDGLYIVDLSGLHAAINPTTADYSVPGKAIVIKGGEMAYPVDNITLSGNLLNFFRNIDSIGDDLKWVASNGMIGAPTISIDKVKVTGA